MNNLYSRRNLFVILILSSACTLINEKTEDFVYQPFHDIRPKQYRGTTYERLMIARDSLIVAQYEVPQTFLTEKWSFCLGDSLETLKSFEIPDFPDTNVYLPHLILMPNTSFWYAKRILPEKDCFLSLDADDGVQVFVNSKPVKANHQGLFLIDTQSDSIDLVVRVINNAMQGGLRKCAFIDVNDYQAFENWQTRKKQLVHYIEQVITLELPNEVTNIALETAILDEPISLLAEKMQEYCSFLAPPYLVKDIGALHVRWQADCDLNESTILLNYDGINTSWSVNSHNGLFEFKLSEPYPDSYKVCLGSVCTKDMVPHTAETDETFSFSVWADSQGGWSTFQLINDLMSKENISFSAGIGDLVSQGNEAEQWQALLKSCYPYASQTPYYFIPGNHDYDGYYDDLVSKNYEYYFNRKNGKSYFQWFYGNAAFIALDANRTFPVGVTQDSSQYKWLHETLNDTEWSEADWRFVLVHQPPYSQGWPDYHGEESIRSVLNSYINQGLIDVVVSGHSHNYERLLDRNGDVSMVYVLVGGAGGALEPTENSETPQMDVVVPEYHYGLFQIQENNCHFIAKNIAGKVIDEFTLEKKP